MTKRDSYVSMPCPAVTTRHINSSYVGCPNNTLSLLISLKTYLNILLYIGLNLQILSLFCHYVVSHSVSYRFVTHIAKSVTLKYVVKEYKFILSVLHPPHFPTETYH